MTGSRICIDCDKAIIGVPVVVADGHSMSGARPDMYAHADGDEACQPPARSRGGQHRRAMAEEAANRR
ncbi:hypothetical protein [Streptomyces sp. AM 2-1-1]|uniref:hypothetical protein n=1 Tax=Streptomyces sp. AM 2-1-1 TaxID=3028709 RepID=UPI0023B9F1BA|nr:hypothetical protein [Streptomyces sp. AM 2-1-1]WEH40818.1 hypothetical protein PZB77_15610 [Streptomyces sp. AM 2-1-1]